VIAALSQNVTQAFYASQNVRSREQAFFMGQGQVSGGVSASQLEGWVFDPRPLCEWL